MEEIGAADMASAVTLSVHILSQYPVVTFGTAGQHADWLAPMLAGEALGAFCLTEPHAGSDAAALRTRAVRLSAGGEELPPDAPADAVAAYRLHGTKIWISNAPEAERYLVFATLDPSQGPEGDHGVPRREGHARASRSAPTRRRWASGPAPLPSSSSTAPSSRSARRLGDEGQGYRIALSALAEGRISIAAACVGIARSALEQAAAYLHQRTAFGAPLAELQGLRFMLAEMAREVAAARALTHEAARAKDRGEPIGEAVVARQVDGVGCRHEGRHGRRPALRRERLLPRDRDRAPDARREGRPDLRGHQPGPPASSSRTRS